MKTWTHEKGKEQISKGKEREGKLEVTWERQERSIKTVLEVTWESWEELSIKSALAANWGSTKSVLEVFWESQERSISSVLSVHYKHNPVPTVAPKNDICNPNGVQSICQRRRGTSNYQTHICCQALGGSCAAESWRVRAGCDGVATVSLGW